MSKVLNFYHIGKKIPDNAIYIGRGNSKFNLQESKFANPFPITEICSRQEVIDKYKVWLWDQIKNGSITKEDILSLDGKDLVCYCNPHSCHGDVLLKAIEYFKKENTSLNEIQEFIKSLTDTVVKYNKDISNGVNPSISEKDYEIFLQELLAYEGKYPKYIMPYSPSNIKITWSRKEGYQINSKSDKRFSAFNAILNNGKSIEETYQVDVKGYSSIKEGKGKPPLNKSKDLFTEYLGLWRIWSIGKDELLLDLFNKVKENNYVLGDFFASTEVNQAHALSVILNEKYLGYKRVIVAGSRTIIDYSFVKEVLDNCHFKISTIVSGAAKGVDSLGERYAKENNISIERFPAQWDNYGNSAGYIRNTLMANNADCLICIWDGKSKGTKHMLDIAKSKNLNVFLVLKNAD